MRCTIEPALPSRRCTARRRVASLPQHDVVAGERQNAFWLPLATFSDTMSNTLLESTFSNDASQTPLFGVFDNCTCSPY